MAENKDKVVSEVSEPTDTHEHMYMHRRPLMALGVLFGVLLVGAGVVGVLALSGLGFRHLNLGRSVTIERGGAFEGRGMMGRTGRGMMFGFNDNVTQGKVAAVSGQKITIDASGTTKTVQIGTDTRFPLNSTTKIAVGDTISVVGEQDSTGAIQALRVIVNPTSVN